MGGAALTRSARAAALAPDAAAIASACVSAAAAAASPRLSRSAGSCKKYFRNCGSCAHSRRAKSYAWRSKKGNLEASSARTPRACSPSPRAALWGVPGSGSTCFESPAGDLEPRPLIPSTSPRCCKMSALSFDTQSPPSARDAPRSSSTSSMCPQCSRSSSSTRSDTSFRNPRRFSAFHQNGCASASRGAPRRRISPNQTPHEIRRLGHVSQRD